jgi:hypothetical protein
LTLVAYRTWRGTAVTTAVLEVRQIYNTSFAEIAVLPALGGTVGDLGRLRRHGRGSRVSTEAAFTTSGAASVVAAGALKEAGQFDIAAATASTNC